MSPKILDKQDLHNREAELIDTAIEIMRSEGTAGLTMDKVVAKVPYSKGTVYNHFTNKEDLLTGVCNSCMSILTDLFQRAADFNGSPRERMLAILYAYLLHAQLRPDQFMLVVSAKTANMMERTSERRMQEHRELEQMLLNPMVGLVQEAVKKGEFSVPPHMSIQQICFSLWSTAFGAIALLISHTDNCTGRDGLSEEREAVNNSNLLLDGLNWRPLSTEHDYQESLKRIAKEVFSSELKKLKANGNPTPYFML